MNKLWIVMLISLTTLSSLTAQENTVTVPDVVDLTVAQAAGALNRAGLRLGQEIVETPPQDQYWNPTVVVGQSLEAGSHVVSGSIVDVIVYRENNPNMLLLYDDNDITLVNQSGTAVDSTKVVFISSNTRFSGARWGGTTIAPGDCVQLWSVGRSSGKSLDQCGQVRPWMTTNDRNEHFWTSPNADDTFVVIQNGLPRAECPKSRVANEVLSCAFTWTADDTNDGHTPYIYLIYTPTQFQIWNNSRDEWMPLRGIRLEGDGQPTTLLVPNNLALFDNSDVIVADLYRLAPNQCIYYTAASATGSSLLQACDEAGRVSLPNENYLWTANFNVISHSIAAPAACPAAEEGRLTVCIVPR